MAPNADGWIKLHRKLQDSPVWGRPHELRLWIYLLVNAQQWKTIRRGDIEVRPGQLLRSYRVIAADNEWVQNRATKQWSTSRVKRMLDWLEGEEMISTLGTELGTLITIENFPEYQEVGAIGGADLERHPERSWNNNKIVRSYSPPKSPPRPPPNAGDGERVRRLLADGPVVNGEPIGWEDSDG